MPAEKVFSVIIRFESSLHHCPHRYAARLTEDVHPQISNIKNNNIHSESILLSMPKNAVEYLHRLSSFLVNPFQTSTFEYLKCLILLAMRYLFTAQSSKAIVRSVTDIMLFKNKYEKISKLKYLLIYHIKTKVKQKKMLMFRHLKQK